MTQEHAPESHELRRVLLCPSWETDYESDGVVASAAAAAASAAAASAAVLAAARLARRAACAWALPRRRLSALSAGIAVPVRLDARRPMVVLTTSAKHVTRLSSSLAKRSAQTSIPSMNARWLSCPNWELGDVVSEGWTS